MRSISAKSTSTFSGNKRRGASKRAIAGRSLLGAALLASTALIALPAGPAFAEDLIVDGQDREVINKPVDLDGGGVFVGVDDGDDATLTIADGGELESGNGYISNNDGSKGTVTVSRGGSWVDEASILVGYYGEGALNVLNGGYVRADGDVNVGTNLGSTGTVTVSGKGSRLVAGDDIVVGNLGEGTLNVSNGGFVQSYDEFIIGYDSVPGTVTVSGKDSRLVAGGDITVGNLGEGTLNVLDGGYVQATGSVEVGRLNDGVGTITVSGRDSKLKATNDVYIGYYGAEGTLTVSNSGVVEAGGAFVVASYSLTQGTLNIGAASGEEAQAAGFLQGADGAQALINFGDGDGTIVFNHTDEDYDFDAIVSGEGLLKHEAGNTNLTGDWSGFGGTGEISGGVLSVDTEFLGTMNVLDGGALAGSGIIEGEVEFEEGGFFQVDIGSTDVLEVAGTVTIDSGADVRLVAKGPLAFELDTATTILTGELAGEFGSVVEDLLFLDGTLSFNDDSVELTVNRNDAAFSDFTRTQTQADIADAIDSLGAGNGVFDSFLTLSSEDDVIDAVIAVSGEVHASTQASVIQSAGLTRDMVTWRLRSSLASDHTAGSGEGTHAGLAYGEEAKTPAAFDQVAGQAKTGRGYGYWGQAYGAYGKTNGSGESHTTERSTGGLLTGIETGYGTDWLAGIFLGYSHTETDVDDLKSQTGMDSFTAGAYAGRRYGAFRVQYGAAAGIHDIDSERNVVFSGFDETVTTDYRAATVQAFGEVGYTLSGRNGFTVEPFAGAALVYQHTDGFTEEGGDSALTGSSASTTLAVTTLGIRNGFDLGRLSGGTPVSFTSSIAWNHTFGDITPTTDMVIAAESLPFTIAGNVGARDVGLVGLGLNFAVTPEMDIAVDYTGAFGRDQQDHALSAELNARF
ncbi:autotransporter domain-containing protein [Pseudohoeflea suaedae]|uniref:Autotransporter domain-containing protein n=1 Tax=Pseudohoeflea suaedae TaxID=877384 RepID=A0A4V3A6Z1_9HYPH|nr:autotransporter outer membrane beta-barrel domain-containing protein [Pseudohoeflea suaedae]TDH35652.1 autotransporter domain-containing protein [Pseudohoeflea suaedae]